VCLEKGFTADGYILDQDCFENCIYRGISSAINGCGWIAAYNFLHGQGKNVSASQVHLAMNAYFPRQMPGPTPVRVLRRYLRDWGEYPLCYGRKKSIQAATTAQTGIVRYWEGEEPHFVAFVRADDDRFRFFNVCDGQEEICLPMEEFVRTHCRRGCVRVITAG